MVGKRIDAHSVLSFEHPYLLHCMSLFKMPVKVEKRIEKMQRDFFWEGSGEGKRDHLVRWEVMCQPRPIAKGGLGIGNIRHRNVA